MKLQEQQAKLSSLKDKFLTNNKAIHLTAFRSIIEVFFTTLQENVVTSRQDNIFYNFLLDVLTKDEYKELCKTTHSASIIAEESFTAIYKAIEDERIDSNNFVENEIPQIASSMTDTQLPYLLKAVMSIQYQRVYRVVAEDEALANITSSTKLIKLYWRKVVDTNIIVQIMKQYTTNKLNTSFFQDVIHSICTYLTTGSNTKLDCIVFCRLYLPAICFILINNNKDEQAINVQYRFSLVSAIFRQVLLIEGKDQSNTAPTFSTSAFILDLLVHIHCSSFVAANALDLSYLCYFYQQLFDLLLSCDSLLQNQTIQKGAEKALLHLLSICWDACTGHKQQSTRQIWLLIQLYSNMTININNEILVLSIASLLHFNTSAEEHGVMISIANAVLLRTTSKFSVLVINYVKTSLLQLLAVTANKHKNKIEELLLLLRTKQPNIDQTSLGADISHISNAKLQNLISQFTMISSLSDTSIIAWLNSLHTQHPIEIQSQQLIAREHSSMFGKILTRTTAIQFLFYHDKAVRKAAINFIKRELPKKALFYISFLRVFLERINEEDDSELQIEILSIIPMLGSSTACVTTVLKAIEPFSKVISLIPTTLRLMCSLWLHQERIFPKFSKMLKQVNSTILSGSLLQYPVLCYEAKLSVASCLHDICVHNTNRGLECIAMVSQLLKENDNVIFSLGLKSLKALCEADALDFRTAWNVIRSSVRAHIKCISSNKQSINERIVLCDLCALLQVGAPTAAAEYEATLDGSDASAKPVGTPNVEEEEEEDEEEEYEYEDDDDDDEDDDSDDEANEFFVDVLNIILLCTAQHDKDVRSSAILALTEYATCSKNMVRSVLPLDDSMLSQLLASSDQHSTGLIELLLEDELKLLKRNQQLKPAHCNSIYSKSQKTVEYVNTLYNDRSVLPSLTGGLAGAALWSYSATHDSAKFKSEKGAALVLGNECKRMLADISTDVRSSHSWILRVQAISAWPRFMKICVPALIDAQKVRLLAAQKNKAKKASEKQEAKADNDFTAEATQLVVNSLIEKLTNESCLEIPAVAENGALALMGATLALSSTANVQIEQIVNKLELMLSSSTNDFMSCGAAIALGGASHALHRTDIIKIENIITLLHATKQKTSSPWVIFSCNIALGLVAGALQASPLSTKGSSLLQPIIIELENSIMKTNNGWDTIGAGLGLGFVAQNTQSTSTIMHIYKHLCSILDQSMDEFVVSAAYLALPTLLTRGYSANLFSNKIIWQQLQQLLSLTNSATTQIQAICNIAATSLLHNLIQAGFPITNQQIDGIGTNLLHQIEKCNSDSSGEITNSMQLQSVVIGYCNMLGANLICPQAQGSFFYSVSYLSNAFHDDRHIKWATAINKHLKAALQNPSSQVSSVTAWAIGSLGRPFPPSYNNVMSLGMYITKFSEQTKESDQSATIMLFILKTLNNLLENTAQSISPSNSNEASTTTTKHAYINNNSLANGCFSCLHTIDSKLLPKINWAPIIQQVMNGELSEALQIECVKFCIKNSQEPSLASLISNWLEPIAFAHLPLEVQKHLVASISKIISIFASSRSLQILKQIASAIFTTEMHSELCLMFISMLSECLSKEIANAIRTEVHNTAFVILNLLGSPIKDTNNAITLDCEIVNLLHALANCIAKITSDRLITNNLSFEQWQENNHSKNGTTAKSIIISSKLVLMKRFPLQFLIKCRSSLFDWPLSAASILSPFLLQPLRAWYYYNSNDADEKSNNYTTFTTAELANWFLDCLDVAAMCKSPQSAISILSDIAVSWTNSNLLVNSQVCTREALIACKLSAFALAIESDSTDTSVKLSRAPIIGRLRKLLIAVEEGKHIDDCFPLYSCLTHLQAT